MLTPAYAFVPYRAGLEAESSSLCMNTKKGCHRIGSVGETRSQSAAGEFWQLAVNLRQPKHPVRKYILPALPSSLGPTRLPVARPKAG